MRNTLLISLLNKNNNHWLSLLTGIDNIKNINLGFQNSILLESCGCTIRLPSKNKDESISCLQYQINKRFFRDESKTLTNPKPGKYSKVFLTSERPDRIANINEVINQARNSQWQILNPLKNNLIKTLSVIRYADTLISENGSILFNCFLSRNKPYRVLTSSRSREYSTIFYEGGYTYNKYHESIIMYIYCSNTIASHHPYSDRIIVDPRIFNSNF